MTPTRTTAADHARHDRLVVVRYLDLDDDMLASEVTQAHELLATCTACAALGSELQLISDATNRMALPSRPRDFRLTPQQAASLRPGGFRRFVENLGTAFRFEFLRPLAGAAVAIGLLLAVVGTLPSLRPAPAAAPLGAGSGAQITAAQGATAGPTAAPALLPQATDGIERDTASPGAGFSGPSQLPAMTAESSAPGPNSPPTGKTADATAAATDSGIETQTIPAPAASPATQSSGPAATDTTTAIAAGTPAASVDPAQYGGGGAVLATDRASDAISPLVILGVLLASVGLVVFLLTFVSRRIGRSAG